MKRTRQYVRRVGRFGLSTAASALRILPLVAVSLVAIHTVPVMRASELTDNQKVLTKYQHVFLMDQLHIQLVMCDRKLIQVMSGNPNAVAASIYNPNSHYGVVWVMTRSEYTHELFTSLDMKDMNASQIKADQRNSVVHELVHFIWDYAPSKEFAVQILTGAINP